MDTQPREAAAIAADLRRLGVARSELIDAELATLERCRSSS
jgi:hypothetical protein